MPEQQNPDDLRNLWTGQPVDPAAPSLDDLRRKALRLERCARLRFRFGLVLLAFLAVGYASFLFFFPAPMQRAGAVVTLLGFLYGARDLYRRGRTSPVPDASAAATAAAYRAELERQRDFALAAPRRLVAFVPGPVLFISAFIAPDYGPAATLAIALALAAAPFVAGVPANRRLARALQREIDALNGFLG